MFSKFFLVFLLFAVKVNAIALRGFVQDEESEADFFQTKMLEFPSEWSQFTEFQTKFNKVYETFEEVEARFSIFRENLRGIISHNMISNRTFSMGVNQFTDLTPAEFKDKYITGLQGRNSLGAYGCKAFSSNAAGAPASIDWREKGVVNPVRDQGQCGSCWAFSTTSNSESVWAISKGQLLDLSEQELVDCATGKGYYNMGCNGGQMDSAFKFIINEGQCADSTYPYTSGTSQTAGSCKKCDSVVKFTSCYDVTPNDQIALKGAVAKNPVVVAIEADTRYFQSYSSGILTDATKCGKTLDHAVEIVSYNSENGVDYWVVRNSWGESWGEQGYVKIARSSSTNDPGVCGIAMEPSFIAV